MKCCDGDLLKCKVNVVEQGAPTLGGLLPGWLTLV